MVSLLETNLLSYHDEHTDNTFSADDTPSQYCRLVFHLRDWYRGLLLRVDSNTHRNKIDQSQSDDSQAKLQPNRFNILKTQVTYHCFQLHKLTKAK